MALEEVMPDIESNRTESNKILRKPGKWKLHLALITVQVAFSGFEILSRLALDQGAGKFSFSFYRNCVAALVLGIGALLFERKEILTLGRWEAVKIFWLGLIGVTINQMLYLTGLGLTSAVFASTLRNCIPVFTYLLALLSRREKLNFHTISGRAKLAGCALSVGGSLLLSLYRGPALIRSHFNFTHLDDTRSFRSIDLRSREHVRLLGFIGFTMTSWGLGAICLALSCLAFASFLILQVPILERYPAPISFASLSCFSSVLQLPVLAALFEPNHWSRWTRVSTREAITITYAGVFASGFVCAAQSWGVQRGGPVIVASYQPLETVITALLGLIFLRENLHLGSLLGAVIVIVGLYLLTWGQGAENKPEDPAPAPAPRRAPVQHSLSKSSFDSSRVFPEPDRSLESCRSVSVTEEIPRAVSVMDVLENSKYWRVYTVNSSLEAPEIQNSSETCKDVIR